MTPAEIEHWKLEYPPEWFHARLKDVVDRDDARKRESLREMRKAEWLVRR